MPGRILKGMPLYEYLCRTCDTRFEARREMSAAGDPMPCPAGHDDTRRLLSAFAVGGKAQAVASAPAPSAPMGGGGCGGACACRH